MEQFYRQVEARLKQRGKSIRWLANEVGAQPRTLQSALSRRHRKMDFEAILGISSLLGISLDALSDGDEPTSDQQARELLNAALSLVAQGEKTTPLKSKLSMEGFLDWWCASKGLISKSDCYLERIDIFEPPSEEAPQIKPLLTGRDSLASIEFDVSCPVDLTETLNGFSPECNNLLVDAHLDAIKRGEPVLSHPNLNEPLRDGSQFAMRYRRILAPMRFQGSVVIVNYSETIQDPAAE